MPWSRRAMLQDSLAVICFEQRNLLIQSHIAAVPPCWANTDTFFINALQTIEIMFLATGPDQFIYPLTALSNHTNERPPVPMRIALSAIRHSLSFRIDK
jgi:hypothetical protein